MDPSSSRTHARACGHYYLHYFYSVSSPRCTSTRAYCIAPRNFYVHNHGITVVRYQLHGALLNRVSLYALFFCEVWCGPVVQLGGLVPARPIMMMMIKVIPKIIGQSITTIQGYRDKSMDSGTLIQGNHYSRLASMLLQRVRQAGVGF